MSASDTRILVVDDDEAEADAIARALAARGYGVERRSDALNGLIAVEQQAPAVVVLNWSIPFIGGAIFTHALRSVLADPPVVVALAGSSSDVETALQAGAGACLARPPDPLEVAGLVQWALRER